MANNPLLYNAVICGVTGGNQQRWLAQTAEPDFTIFQAVAITVATNIDSAIPAGSINTSQAALMQSICQGVFSNRDAQNLQHDLTNVIASIVQLYNQFSADALEDLS